MIIENIPLVVFTLLIQCAIGLAFAGTIFSFKKNLKDAEEHSLNGLWRVTVIFTAVSLVASTFHLAKPGAAPTALANLGVSWLSNEILFAGAFFALSILMALLVPRMGYEKSRLLAIITSLIGLTTLVVQGFTYAPEAMPAIANGFPFVIFLLTSIILGIGLSSLILKNACDCQMYDSAIWMFFILYLMVPCVWVSGSEIMHATAMSWGASYFFWASIVLSLVAIIAHKVGSIFASFSSVAVALILARIVFFDATLHTSSLLGMPY